MKTVFKLGLLISSLWSRLVLAEHNGAHVNVEVPPLSPRAAQGQVVFNDNCASCNGVNAQGGASGPPLIHDIYNPGHHGNKAFVSAMQNGVQAHHWRFGNMPAQPQVGLSDMLALIRFVREVQEYNGIVTKQHKM